MFGSVIILCDGSAHTPRLALHGSRSLRHVEWLPQRSPTYEHQRLNSVEQSLIGAQNLYTNTARRGPPQTPGSLFGVYMYFPSLSLLFPLKTSFLVYTKPVFAC